LALWVGCLVTGAFATGAVAHEGHGGKLGKVSSKGKSALKVEIRGSITAISPAVDGTGSITLTANAPAAPPMAPVAVTLELVPAAPLAPISFTCMIPAGTDPAALAGLAMGTRVKAKCRSNDTGLMLTKLRMTDSTRDKVEVEARGKVVTFAPAAGLVAGSIVVDTAVVGQTPLTCAVTDRTRVRTVPVTGDTVQVECKAKHGVLTAKKIKVKVAKVEAKGALTINEDGSVTVGAVTCSVPAGMVLPVAGSIVEIKCLGTPPALAKIELEDNDEDHGGDHHHGH
jgi:hypothetical protein